MNVDPVLAWSFGAVGLFAFGFAAFLARRPVKLMMAGGRATGSVESSSAVQVSGKGGSKTYYLPTVAFTTAKGERVVFKSNAGGRVEPARGSSVDVVYDPANPNDAEVGGVRLWLFPVVLAVLGLPFLLVGIAGLR